MTPPWNVTFKLSAHRSCFLASAFISSARSSDLMVLTLAKRLLLPPHSWPSAQELHDNVVPTAGSASTAHKGLCSIFRLLMYHSSCLLIWACRQEQTSFMGRKSLHNDLCYIHGSILLANATPPLGRSQRFLIEVLWDILSFALASKRCSEKPIQSYRMVNRYISGSHTFPLLVWTSTPRRRPSVHNSWLNVSVYIALQLLYTMNSMRWFY